MSLISDERVEELLAMEAASEMQLASNYRNRVIEECARVAEGFYQLEGHGNVIAIAIRALKDKP